MFKAIIFDLGNVVINISFDNIFEYWANSSGVEAYEIKEKFKFDEKYEQFERGEITSAAYRKYLTDKIGLRLSEIEFEYGWNSIYLDVVPGIEELLQKLTTRFRIVALTNSNETHAKKWKKKFASILRHFEKVFCSHEIGARKPEQKAYSIVLEYLQLSPDSVLFLDDHHQNVDSALKLGIKGVIVNSHYQLVDELKKLGIFTDQ